MKHIWIIAAAIVLLIVFARMRTKRKVPRIANRNSGPRVQGHKVSTLLHPRSPVACLFDHGVHFGRGFRRKEGPQLPHEGDCRCELVTFSFTSTEVFNGALRDDPGVRTTIAGLPNELASALLERFKLVDSEHPPASQEEYLEKVNLAAFSPAYRHDIELFLKERYAFLSQKNQPVSEESSSPSD